MSDVIRRQVVWTTDHSWVNIDFPAQLTQAEYIELHEFVTLWLKTVRRVSGKDEEPTP